MHGKKGYMILKLDLEKAYDRLEWSFVMDTLRVLHLPETLLPLIFHCISSPTLYVKNGEKIPYKIF